MDKKQKQKNKSKCLAKSGSKATLQFLDEERPQKEVHSKSVEVSTHDGCSTVIQSNTQQTHQPTTLLEQQSLQQKDQPTTPSKVLPTTPTRATPQKRTGVDASNFTPTKSMKLSSPSSSNLIDLHGYIASLNSTQSSSGNEFFDVKLKTSPAAVQLIKIMKRTNSSISLQYLSEMKSAGTPLMFTKLSPGSNGIFFFNTYKGSAIHNSSEVTFMFNPTEKMTLSEIKKQSTGTFDVVGCIQYLDTSKEINSETKQILREAILYDGTDHMPITLWNDKFCSLAENVWLFFTNLNLKYYFEVKLSTTKSTTVSTYNSEVDVPELPENLQEDYLVKSQTIVQRLNHTLCCPTIDNLELDFADTCSKCDSNITLLPGKRVVNCNHCLSSMRHDKCKKKLKLQVTIDNLTLSISQDVITSFYKQDVEDLFTTAESIEKFKENLLFDENIDYMYNNKNQVTEMKKHSL